MKFNLYRKYNRKFSEFCSQYYAEMYDFYITSNLEYLDFLNHTMKFDNTYTNIDLYNKYYMCYMTYKLRKQYKYIYILDEI